MRGSWCIGSMNFNKCNEKMIKKIKFKLTHNCGGGVFVEDIKSLDGTKILEVRYCKECGRFITVVRIKGKDY